MPRSERSLTDGESFKGEVPASSEMRRTMKRQSELYRLMRQRCAE